MLCKKCQLEKSADDFYVSNRSRCKSCISAAVRANRAKNAEHYRTYDKVRKSAPGKSPCYLDTVWKISP